MHKHEIVVCVQDFPTREKAAVQGHITDNGYLGIYKTSDIPALKPQRSRLSELGRDWSLVHVSTGIRIGYLPSYHKARAAAKGLARRPELRWDFGYSRGEIYPAKLVELLPDVEQVLRKLNPRLTAASTPSESDAPTEDPAAPTAPASDSSGGKPGHCW